MPNLNLISRKQLLRLILLIAFVFFTALAVGIPAHAQTVGQATDNDNLTADILIKTLYAKNNAEKAYCEYMIKQRDRGILPSKTLYAAYRYAVRKDKDRRFAYFQTALESLCKQAKTNLVTPKETSSPYYTQPTKPTTSKPATTKPTSTPLAQLMKLFRF